MVVNTDYVDYHSKIVKEIEVILSNYLDINNLYIVSDNITKILYDYDISKKNTEKDNPQDMMFPLLSI